MISIKLDQKSTLKFSVQISGTTSKASTVFVISLPNYSLSFIGVSVEDKVEITIPRLDGIVEPGKYGCHLEVRIDDRFFVPIKEEIEIKPSLKADAVVEEQVSESVIVGDIVVSQNAPVLSGAMIKLIAESLGDDSEEFSKILENIDSLPESSLQKVREIIDVVTRTSKKK